MSEAKFTKGEWKVDRFVNNKGFEISFNDDGEVVADYVYEEADAHLIAAAPEMYRMLELALSRMDDDSIEDFVYSYQDIKQLLAKARGE